MDEDFSFSVFSQHFIIRMQFREFKKLNTKSPVRHFYMKYNSNKEHLNDFFVLFLLFAHTSCIHYNS